MPPCKADIVGAFREGMRLVNVGNHLIPDT